ncbi:hypothetical protein [Thermobispora bispora]|uniref:hypothetical protein n=1 Tax=Thermobispora bispora TaxID=2006 RepID=UPI00197D24B3|nr:hypothetical protein [Thermobispora bispora]QSI48629.1 hypothetical protein CYL17_12800 [Thermobispora bispora]
MDDRTPTRSDPPGDSNRSAQQKTWSTAFTTLCSIIGLLSWFLPDISLDRKILLTIVLLAAIVAVESRMAFIRERGKKIWDRRYLRVGVIGFAVTAIVAIALIFQLTATPGGPRSLSPSGPRKAAPNVTYAWNAFCAHRYLSRPADLVDPKEVAETDPAVDDPVLADDVWLDISVRRESEAELELTGIRIEEVGRNATPQTGVLVRPATGGCAEGTAQYAWRVELDEHPPAFSPVDLNTRPGEPVTRILLPYTIKAEHETFRLQQPWLRVPVPRRAHLASRWAGDRADRAAGGREAVLRRPARESPRIPGGAAIGRALLHDSGDLDPLSSLRSGAGCRSRSSEVNRS